MASVNPWAMGGSNNISYQATDLSQGAGGGGMMSMLPVPTGVKNPYTDGITSSTNQANSDGAYGQSQQQVGAQNMAGLQSKYQTMAGMDSRGYPSFPNSMGLGSQQAFGVDPTGGASPQINSGGQASSVQPQPTAFSTGMNPWSMQGEALSRT